MGLTWFILCIMSMFLWAKTDGSGYLELAKLFAILMTVCEFTSPIGSWIRSRKNWVDVDAAMKQWTYDKMKGDKHD